jgi:hypothetical protein
MAKVKLSKEARLAMRFQRKLEEAKAREELLGYLAETVLKHFFTADESIDEWIKVAGGVRAKKMMRALKVLFRYPGRGSVGKRLRDALSAQFFARKLDARQKTLKAKPPNTTALMRNKAFAAKSGILPVRMLKDRGAGRFSKHKVEVTVD